MNPTSILSRAASAVLRIKQDHAQVEDRGINAGQWVKSARELRQIRSALAEYGFTPQAYNMELARRTSTRFAHFSNLYAE